MTPKIFGIGFHRTGTSSLRAALERLGYRVCGAVGTRDPDIAIRVREIAFPLLERFDAFGDNPWPVLFRELDERCPGSRFVLTMRPADEWLRSVARYFGTRSTPMREWIYGAGSPVGNETRYRERYERHNDEVREHFLDRPADLLVLRVTAGEGWRELCGFLGRDEPVTSFPHVEPSSGVPRSGTGG